LVRFCSVGFNTLDEGVPPVKTLGLPIKILPVPIIVALATPPGIQPALSPAVIGVVVTILCAGINEIKCLRLQVGGSDMGRVAILGYGMGVGIGPAGEGMGVRQTSGKPISIPPKEQFANIIISH